ASCGLDAVVAAHHEHVLLPGAWRLDARFPRTTIEALGIEVELQRLSREQVEELVVALADADEPVEVLADEYRNVPPEERGVPEPLQARAPAVSVAPRPAQPAMPSLQLLGPVRLHGADPQAV